MRSALACFMVFGCGPAIATEYCVSCEGPSATYRCALEGPTGGANDTRAQYLCITELAKSGKHQTCSVARTRVAPCSGDLKTVTLPDAIDEPLPSAAEPRAAEAPLVAPQRNLNTAARTDAGQSSSPATHGEYRPNTTHDEKSEGHNPVADAQPDPEPTQAEKVQTAVSDAAKSTGETIDKASSAVSSAAKKTWDCMTSLFQSCSGE